MLFEIVGFDGFFFGAAVVVAKVALEPFSRFVSAERVG